MLLTITECPQIYYGRDLNKSALKKEYGNLIVKLEYQLLHLSFCNSAKEGLSCLL